ncbi:MAG: hypothetical protein GY851_28175 [bacterium]|nr:hypothetical protein [bacterium]
MNCDLLKARLNLYAVLQNLEELVCLDAEAAEIVRGQDVTVQFSVRGGPSAHVTFKDGACAHGRGTHPSPSIRLLLWSPTHLNAVFDGKGTPFPLKGFTRLGFLKNEFDQLTKRLEYFLKPTPDRFDDPDYVRINTQLTLNTALFAVRELSELDPIGRVVAGHIGPGPIQLEVLPDGPCAHVRFDNGDVTANKGDADRPVAVMSFRDLDTANAVLTGRLDGFLAIGQGAVRIRGQIGMIDNLNLILDRVQAYLS